MILNDTDRSASKESFNNLIKQNNGGGDEVSEQAIYNVAYLIYCSNIHTLRQLKDSEQSIQTLLADKIILEDKNKKLSKLYNELHLKWCETCDELYEVQQERDALKNKLSERASNE